MAVINQKISDDADRLEQHFSISESGSPKFDPDFLARTLPANLSQDTINQVYDHTDHIGQVVDVIVARAAIKHAKDNAGFNDLSVGVNISDRVTYTTRWDRDAKRQTESGTRDARGVVLSSLSFRTSNDRENTYNALEELATAMLGPK